MRSSAVVVVFERNDAILEPVLIDRFRGYLTTPRH